MADTVEANLERQIPELEDLKRLELFTDAELREIVSKRRDFEYLLKRRAPRRVDYIRYIRYEMQVDAIRKQRKMRKGIFKSSLSDHAGTKHIHYIFDRLLRRFAGDKDAWRQYVEFCVATNASRALTLLFPRILRLHPHDVEFWIRAVLHELRGIGSMEGARVLMQRGLRLNPNSPELWLAYLRVELECLGRVIDTRNALHLPVPSTDIAEDTSPDTGIAAEAVAAAAASTAVAEELSAEEAARKAAETSFLEGGVAKIVYTHALSACAKSDTTVPISLHLKFATVIAEATGRNGRPLAPKLLRSVIDTLIADHAREPELWAWLAAHAPSSELIGSTEVPEQVLTKKSSKKRKAIVSVDLPAAADEGDGGIAAFERGLSTVPAEQQSALLQLYLSHILGKLKAAEPSAAQSLYAKGLSICERLCAAAAHTLSSARAHCVLLGAQGRSGECVGVGEALLKAYPTDYQAWILLIEVTQAAGLDAGDSPASLLVRVRSVCARGIRACSPSLALSGAEKREGLEGLWRRRVEVTIAMGDPRTVAEDFKEASRLGLLTHEHKLWSLTQ